MRTILIFFVLSLVDFKTQMVCNCLENNRTCATSCLSCTAQRKDNNKDLNKANIAAQCPTCDIPVCKNYLDELDFGTYGSKSKPDEVKIRIKRSIIRVPKKRQVLKCAKSKSLINSSCKAILFDGK